MYYCTICLSTAPSRWLICSLISSHISPSLSNNACYATSSAGSITNGTSTLLLATSTGTSGHGYCLNTSSNADLPVIDFGSILNTINMSASTSHHFDPLKSQRFLSPTFTSLLYTSINPVARGCRVEIGRLLIPKYPHNRSNSP